MTWREPRAERVVNIPSSSEMKVMTKMANAVRASDGLSREEVVIVAGGSISWNLKLIKYLPIMFKDIQYNKKFNKYSTLSTLGSLEREEGK